MVEKGGELVSLSDRYSR